MMFPTTSFEATNFLALIQGRVHDWSGLQDLAISDGMNLLEHLAPASDKVLSS